MQSERRTPAELAQLAEAVSSAEAELDALMLDLANRERYDARYDAYLDARLRALEGTPRPPTPPPPRKPSRCY